MASRPTFPLRLQLLLALLLQAALAAPLAAAPKAELWPRWEAHDPAAGVTIDHAAWARFLERHLVRGADGVNQIAYGRVPEADRAALGAYLARLAAVPISTFARPEQMAYWINLYNALTVQVVLDHYPVDSIRDIRISPGWFSTGPWGKKLITVEGEALSLDDIEHRILRPIWRDPRIHYAVNCASIGCPNLQPEPFAGARIEEQLDAAAREFVNGGRALWVEGRDLRVSSIYRWFQEDFGADDPAVIAHLRHWAGPELAARLDGISRIRGHDYDWRLNDARRADGKSS
jgi:hypothetical protein